MHVCLNVYESVCMCGSRYVCVCGYKCAYVYAVINMYSACNCIYLLQLFTQIYMCISNILKKIKYSLQNSFFSFWNEKLFKYLYLGYYPLILYYLHLLYYPHLQYYHNILAIVPPILFQVLLNSANLSQKLGISYRCQV